MHRHLTPATYVWKINDNYAGGVPDAFYSGEGGILFIEYKYIPKPPTKASTLIKPKLSGNQLYWLKGRYVQNVPVAVVVGTPKGSVVFTDLSWETGISRGELDNAALTAKQVASIISDHCIGKTYVDTNAQTHPNTARPSQIKETKVTLDAA